VQERARPPEDISPQEFFTRWVPATVDRDAERRARLRDTHASLLFLLDDAGRELPFTVEIADGRVSGHAGRPEHANLEVHVDVDTWRALNRGEISAPEALLRRRLRISGNLVLALKLHLILG
jgi:putative sterol carrier protein